MRSQVVLSVALVAAAIAPVMSVPIAGDQTTQPPANLNQTLVNEYGTVVDEFLHTLTPAQLHDLSEFVDIALNSTANPALYNANQPQRRQIPSDLLQIFKLLQGAPGLLSLAPGLKRAVESTGAEELYLLEKRSAFVDFFKNFFSHFLGL